MQTKALIAMSGGVDSGVAALLMQRLGYDCVGATMLLRPGNLPGEARGAAEFMLTFALGHRDAGAAYWMLLASHVLALPLIELLSPPEARSLLEAYEAGYPRRDRLPAQKKVISALKKRAKT